MTEDHHPLVDEIKELQQRYTVRLNPEERYVELERVVFPPGWTPRVGTVRFAIPADYRNSPPTVHIPAEMRFNGRRPGRMRRSRFEGMKRWCVTFDWNPRRHTLTSVMKVMMNHALPDPSVSQVAMP